jgi:cytochrome b pre-mRNA-processing protein 3
LLETRKPSELAGAPEAIENHPKEGHLGRNCLSQRRVVNCRRATPKPRRPLMPLARLLDRRRAREGAYELYDRIVAQARQPEFYAVLGVPDTVDGRFELVALHAVLLFERLAAEGAAAGELAQMVFDRMFDDFDRALREMGTGDLSVGKEVKRMAKAFYGRAAAYRAGLAGDNTMLVDALRRNLYGTSEPDASALLAMAAYVRAAACRLANCPLDALRSGSVEFGPMPDGRQDLLPRAAP